MFAPGTPLLTPDGTKPIAQFQPGDWILSASANEAQSSVVARRVKEVVRTRGYLLNITVGGRTIQATVEHPFYVKGKGWVSATSLAAGDLLRSHNDRWLPVESVQKGDESPVYNVRVEENDTFFVGDRDWGFSLWVYGACTGPAKTAQHFVQASHTYRQKPRALGVEKGRAAVPEAYRGILR